MGFKPLLAGNIVDLNSLDDLIFPMIGSFKLDGIRALGLDGALMSRTKTLIPNQELQAMFGRPEFDRLDGELIDGAPNDPQAMNKASRCVMKGSAPAGNAKWYVFDHVPDEGDMTAFTVRLKLLKDKVEALGHPQIVMLDQIILESVDDLLLFENKALEEGYEGVMIRKPFGHYKFGRSSAKEQILLKMKKFLDAEATIIAVNQMMHNENEALKDNFGRTKRSTSKAGKVPAGVMGNLVCRTDEGVEFEIGTGFTAADRRLIWLMRDVIGKRVKFKHQPHGAKDKPRCPVFIGFREDPT